MEKLAEMTAQRTANIVMSQLKGVMNTKVNNQEEEYVDSEEAARILGVSANYLRHIKNKFPHRKVGDQIQGRVMFLRSALLPTYFGH